MFEQINNLLDALFYNFIYNSKGVLIHCLYNSDGLIFKLSISFVSEAVQEYNVKFGCSLTMTVRCLFILAYIAIET